MSMFHHSRIYTVCVLCIMFFCIMLGNGNQNRIKAEEIKEYEPVFVKVVLQRAYLDGELSEEVVNEEVFSMDAFWKTYQDWQLIDQNEDRIVIKKQIDDISPLLKTNGYFGITGDGTLSIFNGKPETNDVIQSFFQIDIKKLESHKHDELMEGIRIQTKDQYLEVLRALETYSKPAKK
jgi:forespore regulator of the sigma-K checkpoint